MELIQEEDTEEDDEDKDLGNVGIVTRSMARNNQIITRSKSKMINLALFSCEVQKMQKLNLKPFRRRVITLIQSQEKMARFNKEGISGYD